MNEGSGDSVVIPLTAEDRVGDRLGGLHPECVEHGRQTGRVEVLLWAQEEIRLEMASMKASSQFADVRGLEAMLGRVQDALKLIQDGSGNGAELVAKAVEVPVAGGEPEIGVPGA